MKFVSKGLLGLGAVTLAAAPLALSVATSGALAGAQAVVEPIVVQFTTVGAHDYVVPEDAHCLDVAAIGAIGGAPGSGTGDGALGGGVEAGLQVVPGQTLQVNVGGKGGDGSGTGAGGAGGFNGGGAGGDGTAGTPQFSGGGGGGGASDIRLGGTTLADRAVVGAGGGGAGSFSTVNGGEGGNPGGDGESGNEPGGGGATVLAAGAGAASTGAPGAGDGQSGVSGSGGAGGGNGTANVNGGGGGGGGGYFGGGGGAGVIDGGGPSGAGGGGSDFIADDNGSSNTGVGAGNNGDGRVTISYAPGDTSCALAPLTITKALTGAPAAGTTFSISIACDEPNIDLGSVGLLGESDHATLQFVVGSDGTAHPVGSDTVSFVSATQCTVTEPVAGGAVSTSLTCAGVAGTPLQSGSLQSQSEWGQVGATSVVTPTSPVCPAPGPSDGSILVNIVWPDQTATVTVTNTFAAAAAAVTPRFTG